MNENNDDFNMAGFDSKFEAVGTSKLPAKVSVWTRFKDFLLQDVETMQLELTPSEKKFVDFWTQEVTIDKAYDFLFQEIKIK